MKPKVALATMTITIATVSQLATSEGHHGAPDTEGCIGRKPAGSRVLSFPPVGWGRGAYLGKQQTNDRRLSLLRATVKINLG